MRLLPSPYPTFSKIMALVMIKLPCLAVSKIMIFDGG